MKPGIRYAAAILAAITAGLLLTTSSAQAIESYGIGAVPANPNPDNPRTKSIFVYEAAPAKVIDDGIKVINNSQEERTIKVYPVDSERSSDGAFACAQAVQAKKEVGGWIKLAKEQVTLGAGATETIPFTVTVPGTLDVGEHNGCIAIEESKPPTQSTSNGIVLSFRSALRVALIVPGDIKASLTFEKVDTSIKDNKVLVSPVVKNDGNVSVDANLHVSLLNIFGGESVKQDGQFAVLTKDASRFNFELDPPFWGGWYTVATTADYKPLNPGTSSSSKEQSQTITADTKKIYVAPQPLAAFIYVASAVIIVGGAIFLILRKRHWRLMHQRTSVHTVVSGETLQSLAIRSSVSWKKLAKLNSLKAPYSVEPGQKLKIPHPKNQIQSKKPSSGE